MLLKMKRIKIHYWIEKSLWTLQMLKLKKIKKKLKI